MTTYRIQWTETSQHDVTITEEELARIKGVTVEELREMNDDEIEEGLPDQLAQLEDDGFDGCDREIGSVDNLGD